MFYNNVNVQHSVLIKIQLQCCYSLEGIITILVCHFSTSSLFTADLCSGLGLANLHLKVYGEDDLGMWNRFRTHKATLQSPLQCHPVLPSISVILRN